MGKNLSPQQAASADLFIVNFEPVVMTGWLCAPFGVPRFEVQLQLCSSGAKNLNDGLCIPPDDWVIFSVDDEDPEVVSPGECGNSHARQHWKFTHRKMVEHLAPVISLDPKVSYE